MQSFSESQEETLKRLLWGIVIALTAWGCTPSYAQQSSSRGRAAAAGPSIQCKNVQLLEARFHFSHVERRKWDTAQLDRMVKLYAESSDSAKTLMTKPEYETFKEQVRRAFEKVREGECGALYALHKKEVELHEQMEQFVKNKLAKKDLKIDRSLQLHVDSDDRERPADETEQAELRRKLMHFQLATYVSNDTPLEEAKDKLAHRYELITKRTQEKSKQDLLSIYLRTYAIALDPHSSYFSPDDLEDFRISMKLSLEGIGAVLSSRDGYTVVEEVVPGGPASRHGELERKDKIIAVGQGEDGEVVDIVDMSLRDVVRMIRGEKGTKVRLQVLRQGETTERHDFVITRDKIDLKQQAAKLEFEEVERDGTKLKLAIIELPSFYGERETKEGKRSAADDVRRLLKKARAEGADGVMLDLSKNGGGALDAAVDITGLFVSRGPIVGIGAPGKKPRLLVDRDPDVAWSGPLVVLTSRASASASEILAGALQDYGRAVIVGDEQTFGKGTVQNVISLPPGYGAIKVTTSMFFLPGGASTQHAGVESDVLVPSPFASAEIGERFNPEALAPTKTKQFRSGEVQSKDRTLRWDPVEAAQLKELAQMSSTRVKGSEEFKELAEKTKKLEDNEGKITIAELFEDKDKDKGDKGDEDDKDDKDDEELSVQAKEALQILADHVISSRTTNAKK